MDFARDRSKSNFHPDVIQILFCISFDYIFFFLQKPVLFNCIGDVSPTALIILDDYFPDNVLIGLECIYQIIQHSYMVRVYSQAHTLYLNMYVFTRQIFQKKGLIDSGYGKLIYHALELLTHQKEARYIIPLYSCMTSLLATMEHWDNTINLFEVMLRDYQKPRFSLYNIDNVIIFHFCSGQRVTKFSLP